MSTSTQNTGILAQSQQFDVIEPAKSFLDASTTGTSSTVSPVSSTSYTGTSVSSSTLAGVSTETKVSLTGTLTPAISPAQVSPRFLASDPHTMRVATKSTNSTDTDITQATKATGATETLPPSDSKTSASSAEFADRTTSAFPTHSKGAGPRLLAPGAVAGLLVGVLALNL